MGFFKKLFGDAADELKKNLEDAKNEMLSNLEEVKQDVMGGFTDRTSNSRDDDEEDDEEPKILLGDFHDGVLTIREGITELDDESLEHYKRIRKIIFPASLERLDSNVIDEQERLEELDFSKVTQLKEIPDDFISGETCIKEFVIPQCVSEVGDGFLGECGEGTKVFVPASVRKLGYINGNNNNDQYVYLFAPNLDISDVEQDIKTLYVLPELYGYYAKQLKECDSEARLREMPEDVLNVYANSFASELAKTSVEKPSKKSKEKTATPKATKPVETTPLDGLVQQIKEQLQSLGLSSFVLYGSDYEGDREYEEVEQLGDEGLLESSSEYAINYDDSYDGNSSVYTKVRKIEIQESGVTFDIEEIYEDNDGDEESRGFHEAQTIDRILESCNRDTVKRGLENILTYLNDETLIKLNKNTGNEAKPEPVLEPKPEPEAGVKVEVEQKEEPIENGGLFSARLEAMITAALQDGVLTDKERELLKRRVEKEGEDWDEVEMIVEARLAEMNPTAPSEPSSKKTIENKTEIIQESQPIVVNKVFSSNDYSHDETSIIVPEGVTELKELCFSDCSRIKEIILPSSLQKIGDYAFNQCSSLTSIIIPDSVITIGYNIFFGCKNLSTVFINLSFIDKNIFFLGFDSLRTIELGENVRKIGDTAFTSCHQLKELVIRNGIEEIGENIVYRTKIRKLFLPPSIRRIGQNDNVDLYCYAPELEELEELADANLFVLPQYLQAYQDQARAEDVDIIIQEIPEEYRYYYDN